MFGMIPFSGAAAGWRNLRLGAGGLITAIDIAPDGTVACRADVFGAYIYNRSATNPGNAGGLGVWQQLLTATSLASSSSILKAGSDGDGVFEVRIAPSNSNVIYMVWQGYVFVSTDKGMTFTQSSFTRDAALGGNIGNPRLFKYKMAVDPINPDIAYLATRTNKTFVTFNGTTTSSWALAPNITANDSNQIGLVAFDSSGGTTGGKTNNIYVSVSGTGLYKSTNAGTSFATVASAPSQIRDLQVASDGTVYCIDSASALHRLVGTTWTTITPSGISNVGNISLDPSSASHIIAWSFNNGGCESSNAGSAWGSPNSSITMTATDTPMIGTLDLQFFTAGMGATVWDPSDTTKLWCSCNQGVWNITVPLPTSTPVLFHSVSAGIEEIVVQDICCPPGSPPIVAGQDVAIIQQSNLPHYALSQSYYSGSFLELGACIDYASSNHSFVAAIVDFEGAEVSGYSTTAGATGSWTAFANFPSPNPGGGSIACATDQEMIWVQGSNGGVFHTLNRGASWSTISGLPGATDGWNFAQFSTRKNVAADRVNIGTFYIQNAGASPGTYVVSNSGATVVYNANTIDLSNGSILKAVPGNAGHLFFTSGFQGSGGNPVTDWPHNQLFYYSHNAGATWTDVSSLSSNNFTIREVWGFGFGMAKPGGGGYPTIYLYGWVNAGSSASAPGSTPAMFASYDNCVTWVQIGPQYPIGWVDGFRVLEGDMNIFGRVYAGYTGSGAIYLG